MILAQASETSTSSIPTLIMFLFLGVVFYLMIVRPQRSRMRKQAELADSLEIGDQVQTVGGIFGSVRRIDEDGVVLEVENGSLKFSKRAIATKVNQD
ncbi:MAG: preprotein translocase subunit YajC [Acidimicrobiia bacterium]|nr:preprotein translocase subunit YajC [Acidimicrobiia bacterium]